MNKNLFAPCSIGIVALSLSVTPVPAFAQGFGPPVMDITGHWANRQHEDQFGRTQGEELGDYTGTPVNEAARQRADLWDAALYGLDEWQCRPHTSPNIWRSVYPAHISKDIEPVTGETIAYHINFQNLIDRVIWMDGRPHPSEDAAHTWAGFSTGKWEGDILTVMTTHLKEYILKRNGVPHSDRATMVEHIIRHGDFLTRSTTRSLSFNPRISRWTCTAPKRRSCVRSGRKPTIHAGGCRIGRPNGRRRTWRTSQRSTIFPSMP